MTRKNEKDISLLARRIRWASIAAATTHRRDSMQELMDLLEDVPQHDSDQRPRPRRAAGHRPRRKA